MNKCTINELEKIEKKISFLKNIWPDVQLDGIIILSKYQLLCLGALLKKPVIPGITPVYNLDDAKVNSALKGLQKKQIYFPRFSGVGEVDENVAHLINELCEKGEKREVIFNNRAGKVVKFFFAFDEDDTILIFKLSEGNYVICTCTGAFKEGSFFEAGEISADVVKNLKKELTQSLGANNVKEKLSALNNDSMFVNGIYDCLTGKANNGMFCKYNFDGLKFNCFESGFVVCGNGSGGTIKLRK